MTSARSLALGMALLALAACGDRPGPAPRASSEDVAMAPESAAPALPVPAIDRSVPAVLETATFALG